MKKISIYGICFFVALVFAGAIILMSVGPGVSSALAKKTHIRLGTSKEGSTGYSCGVGLSSAINKNLTDVSMEAVPTPGSTASVKIFSKKNLDMAYASTWTLRDAYNDTGPFAKKPITRRPMQGWYYLTADWILLIKADRSDINSFHDMIGKKVFPHVAGSGIYDVYRSVFKEIGIWDKMKIRQTGLMDSSDSLQMGTIDVAGANSIDGGLITSPWVRNIDARLKIKILVPSAEEQSTIRKIPGITFGKLSNKWMRPANQALNPKVLGWSVHYGFHPGPDMPTEVMYKIYKVWMEKGKTDLAPVNATLKFASEHSIDLQVNAIDEARDLPVHPGVAKYLKEKGLWKSTWNIGKLNPGVN